MLKDPAKTRDNIAAWIKEYFEVNMPTASAVIGISGGKDSSIVASLCTMALGNNRVVGVLMPDGCQSDILDSYTLINHLNIKHVEFNISDITAAFYSTFSRSDAFKFITGCDSIYGEAKINIPPRIRMTVLYAIAQSLQCGGLVINTCNHSEDFVGYSTKFGDAAGDLSPLGELTVQEVLQLGDVLDLPPNLVHKTPSDGLSGMSDENKLGFTYAMLDEYIETGLCNNQFIKERIDLLHRRNLHKLLPMPSYHKENDV